MNYLGLLEKMFGNPCSRHFNDAVISIASSLREFMKAKRRQIYEVLQSMSTTRTQKVEK